MRTYHYTVWSLDVWGNETDGFDVNDRHKVGTVDIDHDTIMGKDRDILRLLVDAGYLTDGAEDLGVIDGEADCFLYVNEAKTGRPCLQLECDSMTVGDSADE